MDENRGKTSPCQRDVDAIRGDVPLRKPAAAPMTSRRESSDPQAADGSCEINFYTIDEVADGLHVTGRTVWRWIKARKLVAHRFGRVVRVARSDLQAFLALHRDA
jgi:excisionase family DNA binding protein